MHISILVPAFNEEKTIASVLHKLAKLSLPETKIEIIAVDDGSTDDTLKIIEKMKKEIPRFTVIHHEKNLGKGSAIQSGIKVSKGDYILIQDADLEYDPADINVILAPVREGKAKVVYGTRLKRLPNFQRDERTATFFMHYLGNRVLSFLTSFLYGQWITDMETGYKLFPKKVIENVPFRSRSFDFEPEITAKLLKQGYKIFEVPISTNPRDHTEGKKLVALKDGPIAFWTLIKYRFVD